MIKSKEELLKALSKELNKSVRKHMIKKASKNAYIECNENECENCIIRKECLGLLQPESL